MAHCDDSPVKKKLQKKKKEDEPTEWSIYVFKTGTKEYINRFTSNFWKVSAPFITRKIQNPRNLADCKNLYSY